MKILDPVRIPQVPGSQFRSLRRYTFPCKLAGVGKKKESGWDGRAVRALRRHMKLSQDEMAARLGTRQQTVSEWETGRYRPRGASVTLLTMIAERAEFEYGVRQEQGTGNKEQATANEKQV